jgi:protein-tyrosine phosphatase
MINKLGDKRIFIGDANDSRNLAHLKQYKIDAIVNVALDLDTPFFDYIRHYKIGLLDGPGNKFYDYWIASTLLISLLEDGKNVLIHCHEGKSRSVAIALIVISLINYRKLSVKESVDASYKYIKKYRPDSFIKKSHFIHIMEVIKCLRSLPEFIDEPKEEKGGIL